MSVRPAGIMRDVNFEKDAYYLTWMQMARTAYNCFVIERYGIAIRWRLIPGQWWKDRIYILAETGESGSISTDCAGRSFGGY